MRPVPIGKVNFVPWGIIRMPIKRSGVSSLGILWGCSPHTPLGAWVAVADLKLCEEVVLANGEWDVVEKIVVTDINAERRGGAVGTTDGNFFELGGERVITGVVASWQR